MLDDPAHASLRHYVQTLNGLLQQQKPLYERDLDPDGFRWIDCHDNENSIVAFMRSAGSLDDFVIMVFNFTPVPRGSYRLGVPVPGYYTELLNSDSALFGGGNLGNGGGVTSEPIAAHGFNQSVRVTVPPLACLMLKKR